MRRIIITLAFGLSALTAATAGLALYEPARTSRP